MFQEREGSRRSRILRDAGSCGLRVLVLREDGAAGVHIRARGGHRSKSNIDLFNEAGGKALPNPSGAIA